VPCGTYTKVLFPPNHRGGRMLGYRFDPPSGPSKTVITGLTGGGHPVTHLDEYATAMQARGITFISLVWPAAHNGYSFQHFSNGTGPTDLAGVAVNYMKPVADYLRANGATRVIGFGWALGNRFARLSETALGCFDGVILASAGDTFGAFTGRLAELEEILGDSSKPEAERFAAWRELYLGSGSRDMVVPGGWGRAHDSCVNTYAGFINVFAGPLEYLREEWTTAKSAPILLFSGLDDMFAPVATNGRVYKAWAPDTITLIEVAGSGHMIPWEHPGMLGDETIAWLEATFPDPCKPWCNQYLCNNPMCSTCHVCARQDRGHGTCSFWCNAYTCGNSHCAGCDTCAEAYCASWCNSFTAGKMVCAGC
jgi:pimeloyl-ACP methyl ester carboxylesterase